MCYVLCLCFVSFAWRVRLVGFWVVSWRFFGSGFGVHHRVTFLFYTTFSLSLCIGIDCEMTNSSTSIDFLQI